MVPSPSATRRFAARCAWAYRASALLVGLLFGGIAVGTLLLVRQATWPLRGDSDLFRVLLVIAPLIAFSVSQLTAHRARRSFLLYLRRQIRANLFRRGLWASLLAQDASPANAMSRLYSHYPQLCRSMRLEPFSAEYRMHLHPAEPRFVLSHLYVAQLWRQALGQALQQELEPHTPGRRFL